MDPEHAFDAADDASNRPAHHCTDGSGRLVSYVSAMRDAIGNALRLRRKRASQRCGDDACEQDMKLHATTPLHVMRCPHVTDNQGVCAAAAWRRQQ